MTIKVTPFSLLSTTDLYKILRLRAEVFVVEQNCPYQDLDNNDQKAYHIWTESNGDCIAYCRVFELDKDHVQIGRVVSSKKARGKGYGRLLMKHAIETCERNFPGKPILIHSQAYATGFYEKFGFSISSEEFLEDGIPHYEMIRN